MSKFKFILTIICMVISVNMVSQTTLSEAFSRETFTLGTTTIPYRKANICTDSSVKPILVLYLHGGSSRGNDNEAQLNEAAVEVIYNYLASRGIASVMTVPQCPANGGWTSPLRKVVNELMKSLVTADYADESRIYVLGGSMGGTGTWAQLSYFPNFYAAAIPVAGNPAGCDPSNVATTPVRTVMGTADRIMSISNVEDFQTMVIEAGGTLILETETGWTHENTCELSFTDTRFDWLFSQVKDEATSIKDKPVNDSTNAMIYDLSGRTVDKSTKGIYIQKGKTVLY